MTSTESFRQHHKDILQIAGEISRNMNAESIRRDPKAIRGLLSKLSGKLSVHLAMEDNSLYPSLCAATDPAVKATAERFMQEMGGIKSAFIEYNKRWTTLESLQNDPQGFVLETKGIIGALSKRIEKEEKELYALIERSRRAA